jgi:RNA polymerase sigma-70 factor, ECF subfamily
VTDEDWLAERFESHRSHLRSVAYRMLGSLTEADDAVQESWLRLSRADTSDVANLGGWLTTVVSRVCLDMLRSRTTRHEEPLGDHLPDPIVEPDRDSDPEEHALLADSVGIALLVVLETLGPAERLAFVLHDMFGVPFEDIASIIDRTPAAARQLASRARRRVRGTTAPAEPDRARQREVVDAYFAAASSGDFEALVAVLDPEVVLRADSGGPALATIRGAANVANGALMYRQAAGDSHFTIRRVLVNGAVGMVSFRDGELRSVVACTVVGERIAELDILTDPRRLRALDLIALDAA